MTTPNSSDGSIYQAAAAQSTEPTIMLQSFWLNVAEEIRKMTAEDFRTSELPLARIKKIMKMDEDVKMISAEAPVLFAKAAEIFVAELTLRAWIHTEDNKRRTLQRNDIAMAITKYDQFDFLIDIVPREELKPQKANETSAPKTSMYPEQVQYYFQLQQPQNQQQTPATTNGNQGTGLQVSQVIGQQALNTVALAPQPQQQQQITLAAPSGGDNQNQHSVIQLQQQQQSQQNTPQVFHQVVGANGEIQNIPIQLTPAQLQAIQAQMQGKQTNQATVLQTGDQSGQVQFVQQQGTVFQLPQQQTFLTQDSNSNQDGDGDENEQQLTIMAEPASKT